MAAHDGARRRREGPPAGEVQRRADVPRRGRRLPLGQAAPRLRPAGQRARLRPPRLRRPPEGDHRRGGRRPRPADRPAAPVRARRRGRRARLDVQAPRRLRHAQRADRGDRRRRDALLHALALGRLDRRPRPHARQGAVAREPRLLRPVRARADVEDPPRRGRGARAGGARRRTTAASRWSPPSASWSRSCSPSRRWSRRPRTATRRTSSPSTRSSSRRPSPPTTATARS